MIVKSSSTPHKEMSVVLEVIATTFHQVKTYIDSDVKTSGETISRSTETKKQMIFLRIKLTVAQNLPLKVYSTLQVMMSMQIH